MTRFLRPVADSRNHEHLVIDHGQLVGRVIQAASGWYWALPARGGNCGLFGRMDRAAEAVCAKAQATS
jgi:hypothetical protein